MNEAAKGAGAGQSHVSTGHTADRSGSQMERGWGPLRIGKGGGQEMPQLSWFQFALFLGVPTKGSGT